DTAERRFDKALLDETRLAEAYVRHAETLKTIHDSDNTIKAYRRFVERHPKASEAPGFLRRIGETYIALKALGSAADAFKELAESYPGAPEAATAHLSRITCLYQSEAYEQAYEEGAALCAAQPGHPNAADLLLLRGLTEAALKMDDQAAETMREVETRYASSTVAPQALLWRAGRALSSQDYTEARNCFQALADRYPQSDAGQRAPEYLDRLSKMPRVEPRHES
ncbi:MAG: tetratricopeptide repeat protein, partial [FCB group bacterium]|nr:tetratricopeptide repeat protein [FCB group bacterium]